MSKISTPREFRGQSYRALRRWERQEALKRWALIIIEQIFGIALLCCAANSLLDFVWWLFSYPRCWGG